MDILHSVVLGAAVLWVLRRLVVTRRRVRTGQVIIPPLFAATLVFLLSLLGVLALGASPLHLVWLFPLSFVLGLALVMCPLGVNLTLACLSLLAGTPDVEEPQSIPRHRRGSTASRHRRQRRR